MRGGGGGGEGTGNPGTQWLRLGSSTAQGLSLAGEILHAAWPKKRERRYKSAASGIKRGLNYRVYRP